MNIILRLVMFIPFISLSSCGEMIKHEIQEESSSWYNEIKDSMAIKNYNDNPEYPCQGVDPVFEGKCNEIFIDSISEIQINKYAMDSLRYDVKINAYKYELFWLDINFYEKNDSCKRSAKVVYDNASSIQLNNSIVDSTTWRYFVEPMVYYENGSDFSPLKCIEDQKIKFEITKLDTYTFADAIDSANGIGAKYRVVLNWDNYMTYLGGELSFIVVKEYYWGFKKKI